MPGRGSRVVFAVSLVIGVVTALPAQQALHSGFEPFEGPAAAAQGDFEAALIRIIDTAQLGRFHGMLSAEPHPAGSDADARVIRAIEAAFDGMGLSTNVHEIEVYLSRLVDAEVEIVSPRGERLDVQEPSVRGDEYSTHPALGPGWNAYSGSGDVTGEVVYANYGRLEDFEALRRMGVDCTGRIVIARYGGNFRGYKAKYAEEAGAAGLLIYTDPADSVHGLTYPDGGWASPGSIQRGSIKTLPYAGDPLTPGVSVNSDGPRLDPDAIALPRIPVQPIGWGAAEKILRLMSESDAPRVPEDWQGGLLFNYALAGGPDLRVRVNVEQVREPVRTANVIATLPGVSIPEAAVIIGCHHDAWTFGAGDPNAGLMIVLELARVFAAMRDAGHPPHRTIIFAAWGAEEFGIVGSTEWVEENIDRLDAGAIAYLNLDMAAMGPNFWASTSPSLRKLVQEAAKSVPAPAADGRSVFDEWIDRSAALEPNVGTLGGGSDHVPFYCHAGIPSMAMGASGARGVSYHSNYDTLAWYHLVVGDDYEPARMIARVAAVSVARLANAIVIPLDPYGYVDDIRTHLKDIERRAEAAGLEGDFGLIEHRVRSYERAVRDFEGALRRLRTSGKPPAPSYIRFVDVTMRRLERELLIEDGLPGRPWYRSAFVSPDPTSGYSSWMLPLLRHYVEAEDEAGLQGAIDVFADCLDRMAGLFRHASEVTRGRAADPDSLSPEAER